MAGPTRAVKGTNQARLRLGLGMNDPERRRPASLLRDPGRPEQPAGQRRVVDRLAVARAADAIVGPALSDGISTGSRTRTPTPAARIALRTAAAIGSAVQAEPEPVA